MTETALVKQIQVALSAQGSRVFRNNVGATKTDTGHFLRYGLTPGSSDLIGWTPITITPDMVGRTIAVFTAIEAKSERGQATSQQYAFVCAVLDGGGIAAVCKSVSEAIEAIDKSR